MDEEILGCRIFYRYEQRRDAQEPTILLLHGWGCDNSIFSFIESGLSASASVLTLDFPGHGKSDEPPQAWGVPQYAEQVMALLEKLGIKKVRIIAHSFGGRVAIYIASQNPALVDKLVITGGAGIRGPVPQSQQKRQRRYKRYSAALAALAGIKPLAPAVEAWQAALRNRFGSPDYIKLSENMRKSFVKIISQNLFPMLRQITTPTLLIWGSADTETPLWMGQQMEQEIPDAGLVIFEGRSHFAFIEEWQRFLLIVKAFFKEEEGK
ncbi:MAG: alpha/beta hydrolase [Clostridia bacterium]